MAAPASAHCTRQVLLANSAMTEGFTREDNNTPDVIFAARRGTTFALKIETTFPKATMRQFDEERAVTHGILTNTAPASMWSEPAPSEAMHRYPDTVAIPAGEAFTSAGAAFAFQKGDPDAGDTWFALNTRNRWRQDHHDHWCKTDDCYARSLSNRSQTNANEAGDFPA